MSASGQHERGLQMPIGAVEKETRVSKELLRMWERRYGFPLPDRDESGDRVYSRETVEKLKLIRLLIDRGYRPGRLMNMQLAALRDLQAGAPRQGVPVAASLPVGPGDELVALLQQNDVNGMRRWLSQQLIDHGLRRFVTVSLQHANHAVGAAWQRGELAIHAEHLYTEQVQMMLRHALLQLHPMGQAPRVLVTTMPDEPHQLGLLMAEVMLWLEGCTILAMGTELPLADIAAAAIAHQVDVVALSFSAAYGEQAARQMLNSLAGRLPDGMQVWAGGSGVRPDDGLASSIRIVPSLDQIGAVAKAWRTARSL